MLLLLTNVSSGVVGADVVLVVVVVVVVAVFVVVETGTEVEYCVYLVIASLHYYICFLLQ